MKRPIKIVTIILILLVLLPSILLAIGDISGYKLMYSKLNEKQLYSQLKRVNNDIFTASLASTGGVALTGLGVLSTVVGVALVSAEPFITLDPDEQGIFFPLALIGLAFQYVGGAGLIGGGITSGVTGVGLIVTASGNIAFQIEKKRQIQLELKRFQPTSYEDKPGIGIGFSIPLNSN
jgi:hypothetical protein